MRRGSAMERAIAEAHASAAADRAEALRIRDETEKSALEMVLLSEQAVAAVLLLTNLSVKNTISRPILDLF